MANETIEQRVASAILEKKDTTLDINGKTYEIGDPSVATLILISEIISTLPHVQKTEGDKILASVLQHAKDFRPLGDIVAILILGAKGLTKTETIETKHFFGLITTKQQRTINLQAQLAQDILENVRPSVLSQIIIKRLLSLEVGDFFGITTSLSEANILKPTKGEVG